MREVRTAGAGSRMDRALPRVPLGARDAGAPVVESGGARRDGRDRPLCDAPAPAGAHRPLVRRHCRGGHLFDRASHRHQVDHGVPTPMKTPSLYTAVVLAGLALAPVARIEAQETSLTIYNDGRVLVRRTLVTPVPRGTSEQRLALGALHPATLFTLDSGVTITAAAYDGAADEASAIRRALGQTIVFRNGRDTLSATIVGVDPERFRLADGRIVFGRPGQPALPAEVVALEPVSRVTLKSDAARKDLKVGYFTGGADWQASYQAVLGRGSARVTGTAVLGSQSLRARGAEVQLLAGAPRRCTPRSSCARAP